MRVRDIYSEDFATAKRNATLYDLVKIFHDENTNGIFIVDDEGHLEGLVTVFEVLKAIVPPTIEENPGLAKAVPDGFFMDLVKKRKNILAEKIMSSQVASVTKDTKLIEIAADALQIQNYRLAVVDAHGKIIGVVNRKMIRDLIAKGLNIAE